MSAEPEVPGPTMGWDRDTNTWVPRVWVSHLPWPMLFLTVALAVAVGVLVGDIAWTKWLAASLGGP